MYPLLYKNIFSVQCFLEQNTIEIGRNTCTKVNLNIFKVKEVYQSRVEARSIIVKDKDLVLSKNSNLYTCNFFMQINIRYAYIFHSMFIVYRFTFVVSDSSISSDSIKIFDQRLVAFGS